MRGAPRFGDVAGEVLERLRGHVPVAHNARFDQAFLESEFARLGIDISDASWVCTMSLATGLGCGGRLVDCCDACGIVVKDPHSALGDAHACAQLLSSLAKTSPRRQWPAPCGALWRSCHGRHPGVPRSVAREAPRARSFVGTLVARLDQRSLHPDGASTETLGYLQILDRACRSRRQRGRDRRARRSCRDVRARPARD